MHIQDLSDLNDATKNLIKHFFEKYKDIEPESGQRLKIFLAKKQRLKK